MVVNMVRQTMRFDDDIHFKTSSIAKKNNLSFNKFVNLVLEDYLNNSGQNRYFKEVDNRLKGIMATIFRNCYNTAKDLNDEYNLIKGANNYAFIGIAEKMLKR